MTGIFLKFSPAELGVGKAGFRTLLNPRFPVTCNEETMTSGTYLSLTKEYMRIRSSMTFLYSGFSLMSSRKLSLETTTASVSAAMFRIYLTRLKFYDLNYTNRCTEIATGRFTKNLIINVSPFSPPGCMPRGQSPATGHVISARLKATWSVPGYRPRGQCPATDQMVSLRLQATWPVSSYSPRGQFPATGHVVSAHLKTTWSAPNYRQRGHCARLQATWSVPGYKPRGQCPATDHVVSARLQAT